MSTLNEQEQALIPPALRREMEDLEKALDTEAKGEQSPPEVEAQETGEPTNPTAGEQEAPPAEDTAQPALEGASDHQSQDHAVTQEDPSKLQQAYRTLLGKYEHEVPRLNEEVRRLRDELAEAQAKATDFEQRAAQTLARQTAENPAEAFGLDDAELAYGQELWRGTEKVARTAASEAEKRLRTELDDMRRRHDATAFDQFKTGLRDRVRDFDRLNGDPGFNDWLDELDELRGMTRREMLNEAARQRDVTRTARFFEQYLKGQTTTTTPPNPDPRTSASVAAQVVPRTGGSASVPEPKPKPTITGDQYGAEMDRIARLQLERPAEALEAMKKLDQAVVEGRVKF